MTDPQPTDDTGAPLPEAQEAIEEYIPGPAEIAVIDPHDEHEVLIRIDEHDVRRLLERVQTSALKKWVYRLPDGTMGLTVDAVQDVTQQMNWMGVARIGLLPDTLTVERIEEDAGNGPEPFWVATIFAEDERTGAKQSGASMEPMRMRLKPETAKKKRARGMKIPEDNTIFDVFSRTKAINKAERNAMGKFIPEEIEQTIIAMFANDPGRVQRIRTEAEQRLEDLPPALTDERATGQIERCRELYREISDLGGGKGKVEFTPAKFNSFLTQAQHDHDRLDELVAHLESSRDSLAAKYETAA